ncbi:Protein of unknown function (DUF3244) [Belliella baltica DSM 15883]|uniref:Uncharacterized protein n=1 Tax=Belliella baltica (strain DSM 15883 / CIP 108006 / LMG 21964 / BA134) TaxID=866536 RepID=I3Z8K3_BELBD|nr:DUF3244 domain-containing protein [Belliella baltica]AFL85571.1 Protein of unknown function (DUF3244) [Belliella baltica DSM 15883]
MKALFTFALVLSLGASTFASENDNIVKALSHVQVKDKTITVYLGQELKKVRLTINDSKGKKIHQGTLFVKSDIRIPFDLSLFPEGKYQVEVKPISKDQFIENRVFEIETKEVKAPISLPLVASGRVVEDDRIRLAVFGLEDPGVEVKIKTPEGRLLHEEMIRENHGFIKHYYFKGISTTGIKIELKDAKGREKILYF